jgi:flavin reductase (DIM6/NTAB) family NADH-FMN oxidoreductase RutF
MFKQKFYPLFMIETISLNPKDLSLSALHGLLLGAVAPRPIALASTIDDQGRINLSPFSFFNVFSANPPIMIFSPARRGRDNTTKHTYENVQVVPEVVINVVNYPMVQQVSLASSEYPAEINEFVKAGLTAVSSDTVTPPRVAESPVSFECKVNQVVPLGTDGGAGNLVIAEVQLIHVRSEYLDSQGRIATKKLDLVGRMGGNWYCRASTEAIFEVAKPGRMIGLGVDQLPDSIRNSKILTGNSLGKLGGISSLPDQQEVIAWESQPDIREMLAYSHSFEKLQHYAQKLLETNQIEEGLLTLLAADRIVS